MRSFAAVQNRRVPLLLLLSSFQARLHSCAPPLTHFHLKWIYTFHIQREDREDVVAQWMTCCTAFINTQEQASLLPVPAQSDCSLTPLHSCHTGFFFHHILELIPYVKGQKGIQMKSSIAQHVTFCVLTGLTHQPQLLAHSETLT